MTARSEKLCIAIKLRGWIEVKSSTRKARTFTKEGISNKLYVGRASSCRYGLTYGKSRPIRKNIKAAMIAEANKHIKEHDTKMLSDRIAEDLEAYEERLEKKANKKIWKATITGVMKDEELIGMLQLLKQTKGELCTAHPMVTGMLELKVQFRSKNDVEAFDVAVCDLGHTIDWQEETEDEN